MTPELRRRRKTRTRIAPSPRMCLLDSAGIRPLGLQWLNVCRLPSLRPLHHVELHGLTFLQALETTRVNRRVVHEDIFAVLTRDKAEALRVIKPLHSTLFHFDRVSWIELRWMNRGPLAESLLGWASTAHARFDSNAVLIVTSNSLKS